MTFGTTPPNANELLGLLAEADANQRTGVLAVKRPDTEGLARIHLRKGSVVAVESGEEDGPWILGEYLLRTGLVHPRALDKARKRAESTSQPVEQVLVDRVGVPEDVVRRFSDLEMQDHLFALFRHPDVTGEIVDERPHSAPFVSTLPAPYVVKEARRQLESWDRLRRKVGRPESILRQDVDVLGELLGYEKPEDDEEPLPDVSANGRIVYFFTNGKRTLAQVAYTAGLSVFDTILAAEELVELELASMASARGIGELVQGQSRFVPFLVATATYVLLGLCVALGGLWLMSNQEDLNQLTTGTSSDVTLSMERANRHHADRAVRLYELHHRSFPRDHRDDHVGWLLRQPCGLRRGTVRCNAP